jgi:plasmid stabilization system protein ParE
MGRTTIAKTLNWSDRAKANVDAITDFYDLRNGNPDYGNRLIRKFQERMASVVTNPYLGQKWGKKRFRYVIVKPFQLFYRITKTEIIVAAVWDSRRDPKTLKLTR